jgi:hypothetical protein
VPFGRFAEAAKDRPAKMPDFFRGLMEGRDEDIGVG